MPIVYQIKDWDKHFENNKSRERDHCSYVAMPNKQHGMGFTRIMAEPDGASIFGLWALLLQAASQQAKPRGGWLTDDGHSAGTAWTPDDLALRWRRTVAEVERALEVLSSAKVGWLNRIEIDVAQVPAECPPSVAQVPAECPPDALEEKRKEKKPALRAAVSPSAIQTPHQRLMDALKERDGAISDGAAQGKAVKWILENYSEADALACFAALCQQDWREGRLSWLSVRKEIGAWLARRRAAPPKERGVVL